MARSQIQPSIAGNTSQARRREAREIIAKKAPVSRGPISYGAWCISDHAATTNLYCHTDRRCQIALRGGPPVRRRAGPAASCLPNSIGIRNEGMMLSFGSGGSVTELSVTDYCGGKILSPQKQNCLPSTGFECEMATKVETCQYLTSDRDIHNREVRR
jgi:hypothetical protein